MKKVRLNSRGDTIVEVLLSIAILSLVLSVAYGLANTSTKTSIASRERSEAQKLSERQLELLRGYVSPEQPWGANLCFRESDDQVTQNPNECKDLGGRYNMKILYCEFGDCAGVYTVHTDWVNLKGGTDELKLSYKLPATGDIASSLQPPPLPECIDGIDNDGNGRTDLLDTSGCSGPNDQTESTPIFPPSVSPGSYTYTAWHMYRTSGTKKQKTFTVTNTSQDGALPLENISVSLSNPNNSFTIVGGGDTCSGTTLDSGESCTVTIEFFPPSGTANNRYSNAGEKNATLRIDSEAGSSSDVSLRGWAVTDRLAPSNAPFGYPKDMVATASNSTNYKRALRGYSVSCYNDAFNCPTALVLAKNNDLILYKNGIGSSPTWTTGDRCSGNSGGAVVVMGADGNFTLNCNGGTPWASLQTYGIGNTPGRWIFVKNGGELWFMNPSFTGGSPSGKYFYNFADL